MSGPRIDPSLYRDRDLVPIRRAIISVSDKNGLPELVRALGAAGVEVVSTGSTAALIAEVLRDIATGTIRLEEYRRP